MPFRPTSPVYALAPDRDATKFERLVRERLSGLFLDVVCADGMSAFKMKKLQARQQFIYITNVPNSKLRDLVKVCTAGKSEDEILEFVVNSFYTFNERRDPKCEVLRR